MLLKLKCSRLGRQFDPLYQSNQLARITATPIKMKCAAFHSAAASHPTTPPTRAAYTAPTAAPGHVTPYPGRNVLNAARFGPIGTPGGGPLINRIAVARKKPTAPAAARAAASAAPSSRANAFIKIARSASDCRRRLLLGGSAPDSPSCMCIISRSPPTYSFE